MKVSHKMQEPPHSNSRRGFLITALLAGTAYGGLRWWNGRPRTPVYEAIDALPEFRRVAGGKISVASTDPFLGLDTSAVPATPIPLDRLCQALFAEGTGPGVPVAFFTDYACPYCRVLTKFLSERAGRGEIVVSWQETPLLSAESRAAARAALAAGRQGAYDAFSRRLMRAAFSPEPAYLRTLADGIGIDAERLLRDMDSDNVSEQLALSRSVAARFGFFATPSMVIGRTVVVGSLSEARLDQLIAAEAADPGSAC